jgi:hypothetical protein
VLGGTVNLNLLKHVLLSILICTVGAKADDKPALPPDVSMIQVLFAPEKYDGLRITIIGYLEVGSEMHSLYLNPQDWANGIRMDSIEVVDAKLLLKRRAEINMKYVRLVGVFHLRQRAGVSNYGELGRIESCEVWSDPANPRVPMLLKLQDSMVQR